MKFLISFSMSGVRGGNISLAWYDEQFNIIKYYANPDIMTDGNQGTIIIDEKIYTMCLNVLYEMDLNFNILRSTKLKDSGTHGIWYYAGRLYCVTTFGNSIQIINRNSFECEGEMKHVDREEKEKDGPHINSIYVDNDTKYITVHNNDHEGYVYQYINDQKRIVVSRFLSQPHDFMLSNYGSIVCNSLHHEVCFAKVPIEYSWVTKCSGYTRGIAESEDYFWIGNSNRTTGIKSIWQLEKHNGKKMGEYFLDSVIEEFPLCPEIYSVVYYDGEVF